jgi:hypothetical protein
VAASAETKTREVEADSLQNYTILQYPGTDVMILKIFSPKKLAKKLAFFT